MSKARGNSVRVVQTSTFEGLVMEYENQKSVQEVIWKGIHDKRFYLAEQAPICQGRLHGKFGYMSTTPAAKQVPDVTYEYPTQCDPATKVLLMECSRIQEKVLKNSVLVSIQREQWQAQWSKAKEKTSSSESGLFSHCIAGKCSDLISHMHALKTEIAPLWGFSLSHWYRGLSRILEKKSRLHFDLEA